MLAHERKRLRRQLRTKGRSGIRQRPSKDAHVRSAVRRAWSQRGKSGDPCIPYQLLEAQEVETCPEDIFFERAHALESRGVN